MDKKWVVELPSGQPHISPTAPRETKAKLALAALLLSFGKKFLGTIHLPALWVYDGLQPFVILKANSSNLSHFPQKKLISL